ncbi:hypothetical protein ABTA71_19810, partial [Acinetobacter baumannii]
NLQRRAVLLEFHSANQHWLASRHAHKWRPEENLVEHNFTFVTEKTDFYSIFAAIMSAPSASAR